MVINKEKMENLFDMTYNKVIENKSYTLNALEIIAKMREVENFELEYDDILTLSYFIVGYSHVPYIMAIEPTEEQRNKQTEHIETILSKLGEEEVATLGEIEDAFNDLRTNPRTRQIIEKAYNSLENKFSNDVIYKNKTNNIFSLLKNSQFSLNNLKNVQDFLKLNGEYTSENIIKLSTFVAEKCVMTPNSREFLSNFNKDDEFIQKLNEARELFALIRNFMVLEEFVYNFIDRNCAMLDFVEPTEHHQEIQHDVEPQTEEEPSQASSDCDNDIKELFKNGTIDEVLDAIIEGESGIDVDYFIRFLIEQTNNTPNNWSDTEYISAEIVKNQIIKYGERYKELIKGLTKEIDDAEKQMLVDKVNNVLKIIFVQDVEQKMNLLNQLDDNMVNSYQQFLELMASFEQCLAMGNDADTYVDLLDFVNTKYNLEKHGENLTEAQNIEIKISMLSRLRDFIERK